MVFNGNTQFGQHLDKINVGKMPAKLAYEVRAFCRFFLIFFESR